MNFIKFLNSSYLKDNPLCGISTYKDELNLATGACTRQIKKLVLDGTENWVLELETNFYMQNIIADAKTKENVVCSHQRSIATSYIAENCFISNSGRFNFSTSSVTHTTDAFKQWLAGQYAAGTPVTVYYVVATPTTETITVPSGLSGTEEGYLNQSGTPTPTNPIYPTANTVEKWFDLNHYVMGTSTDTITTLPAVLYPNATTATVGLKGNTVQNGTPSPDSPIMPQGTGERTGNLMSFPDIAETTKNGVTYYVSGNSLYINGTSTTEFGFNIRNAFTLKAGTYTNQMYGFTGRRIYYSFNNVNATMCTSDINLFKTFTISEDTTYANALVWINNGVTFNNEKIDFALFESEEPKDYEPYGYKIPISSANTITPVYLGEVETTRRVKKLVLTGEEQIFSVTESISESGTYVFGYRYTALNMSDIIDFGKLMSNITYPVFLCSHFLEKTEGLADYNNIKSGEMGANSVDENIQNVFLIFATNQYTTKADFKTYLQQQYAAGTPVTVWYALAEPTTGIVNEPLRKIGNYVDEVSSITIPVIAGANTISVDTTLQPSEVTATYKGWHPVQSVHERESGAWT